MQISLDHLSDEELLAELAACCSNARRSDVQTLAFLAGVEERRLYLAAAASSMFDYCRRFLLMSHWRAYRCIAGARLCKQFPFLLERIERGELHLSTLAHLASFITPENVHELIEETAGMNRSAIDLFLGRKFGVEPMHGRMSNGPLPYDEELLQMLERARELLSHTLPTGDRLLILKAALRVLITGLEKKTRGKADKPRRAPQKPTKRISRHATRVMFEEHGEQCTFVDERTGARCSSRVFVQRDHRHMQVHGGDHDPKNLRPMCGPHNRWLAEQALGKKTIERRIHFRQRKHPMHRQT